MIKDILVAGAGTSEVNGIYRAIAPVGLTAMFKYVNDANTFYINPYIDDCWTIFDVEEEEDIYHTTAYSALAEDGTWVVGAVGVLPAPTVTAIEPDSGGGGGAVSIQPIQGSVRL